MMTILPGIICFIICICIFGLYYFRQKKLHIEYLQTKEQLKNIQEELINTQKNTKEEKDKLQSYQKDLKNITDAIEKERNTLKVEQENFQTIIQHQKELIIAEADKERDVQTELLQQDLSDLKNKIQNESGRLKQIRDALSASAAAQLREREKEENQKFYMLTVNKANLEDIEFLNSIKSRLHDPVILSKLIWTQYYQKEFKLLCNRVLQKERITGIYKITNIKTQEAYVGQSVDIVKRWMDHIKCGLGINSSATNKLYNAMKEYGVHNFTFELIEECSKEELNVKEAFWIGMYQTNTLGYNITAGNKK